MFNEVVDGQRLCPPLKLSYEEEVRIRKPWKQCLIIQVLSRRVGFRILEQKLLQLWRGVEFLK